MPKNPFRAPAARSNMRAAPGRPAKPGMKTTAPTPTMSNGTMGKSVQAPRMPSVRVTTKARKSMPMPSVKQGATIGTPGRTGS